MPRMTTIELFTEDLKFSAAHFTIFSSEHRENLHGHNFYVHASLATIVGNEGLAFDYNIYKDKLQKICHSLDETMLIPSLSQHLKIKEQENHYLIYYNHEEMSFLKRDVKILPITNVTVEDLSKWILQQLITDPAELEKHNLQKVEIKVFIGPGQAASSSWRKKSFF